MSLERRLRLPEDYEVRHARLVAIVLGALFVASLWLVRVPFMQETDEQAHADYAYALFDAGGFFRVAHGIRRNRVTPEVRYLAANSNFDGLRRDPSARAPAGYGTASYFRRLDGSAPRPSHRAPLANHKAAYVMYNYPIGYYALAALAMAAAYAASHGSLIATYFAARALGIAFLSITLVAAYAVFRSSTIARPLALALTAAFGFMPLTSWVSAYIQPDTLTTACTTVFIALLVRWRARPFDTRLTLAVGAALVTTYFVKQHYALALTAACDAVLLARAIAARPNKRRLAMAFIACVVAPLVAYVAATHLTPVGSLQLPVEIASTNAGDVDSFSSDVGYAVREFSDVFIGGTAFATYWFFFGDLLTPYVANATLLNVLEQVVGFASTLVLGALAYRQMRVYLELMLVARRHARTAIALLIGDPILDVYIAWTLLLLAVFGRSHGQMKLEGRYFLAMTVPAMVIGIRYVPRILPRTIRTRVAVGVASAWLVASLAFAPVAFRSMQRRFYGPGAATATLPARGVRTECRRSRNPFRTANVAKNISPTREIVRAGTPENDVVVRFITSGNEAR